MATNAVITNSYSSTDSKDILEGPLCKWTNMVHGWQYRWFVLDKKLGFLSYYTSRDKMKRGSRRGCIRLKEAVVGIDDEDESTFTISADHRTYHFQAQNPDEKDRWVQALDQTIKLFRKPMPVVNIPPPQHHRHWNHKEVLAEAEGYHLLLEEQAKLLFSRLSDSSTSDKIRTEIKYLLDHSGKFIQVLKENQSIEPSAVAVIDNSDDNYQKKSLENSSGNSSQSLESFEDTEGDKNPKRDSSEESDSDSEEFYDPVAMISVISEEDPSDVEEDIELSEVDDTHKGVAQNKSVIMYMLGQVKIGMDLSKVVLPTFILEKRSLLEMYADFFAHPDVVVSIGDSDDPKIRMVEAVRYYLSAFHTARRGTIAKKPYNPVLGETFECYWDLPGEMRRAPNIEEEDIVRSGPVPYAGYGSLTFIAEQVSHHPPVSAFYVESPKKRMTVSGYVYTQSRFLGLSLATHCLGRVHMHLLDRDEEYSGNLPSAYGRSILTTPWMELGGKQLLECKKTGYYANVEFHCKPFYGGRKHRVTADLFHVSDRKHPFMSIEGEWNGVLYTKLPNGSKEVFVDTQSMPIIRKKVKKLESQEEFESKRKWHKVTQALIRDDVEAASAAKHEIEERQRQEARERKENGVQWKQKHFHSEGSPNDHIWFYNNMLQERLQKKQ